MHTSMDGGRFQHRGCGAASMLSHALCDTAARRAREERHVWRRRGTEGKPGNLPRHVIRCEVTVDLRHLELAMAKDLLKGEQVAAGHDVMASEGVPHRVPRPHWDVTTSRLE